MLLTKVAGLDEVGGGENHSLFCLCCSLLPPSIILYLEQLRRCQEFGAVFSSAEKRRGYSDEQDHNDYLYARRPRHGYSLTSI